MGKQALIIVMAFVVIVGIVIANINFRQLKAAEEITENTYAVQVRAVANSAVQQGILKLMEDTSSELNEVFTINGAQALVRSITSGSSEDDEDVTGGSVHISTNEYHIIATATLPDPYGNIYEATTFVVYEMGSKTFKPLKIPEGDDDFLNNPNNDIWVSFVDGKFVYWKATNSSGHNMSQSKLDPNAGSQKTKEDLEKNGSTIYLDDFQPAQVRLNTITPMTFDMNMIFRGVIRIDGPIIVAPGVKVNIYADRVMWGNWHASSPRPYVIDANIYTPLPPLNQPETKKLYSSIALDKDTGKEINYPKPPNFANTSDIQFRNGKLYYPTTYEDFMNILEPPNPDADPDDTEDPDLPDIDGGSGSGGGTGGGGTTPPADPTKTRIIKVWKELPVKVTRA